MLRFLLAVVLSALASGVVAQVHKCRQSDGSFVYSDLPCPKEANAVTPPNLTNARPGGAYDTVPKRASRGPIDFGSNPNDRFRKARAMVASILIDARACDWDMKVTQKHTPCAIFLGQMLDGGEWSQALAAIEPLIKDDVFVRGNAYEVQALIRDMQQIVQIKELAVIRAGR